MRAARGCVGLSVRLLARPRRLWSPLLYLNGELVFVAGLGMDVRHAVMGDAVLLRWESD